MTYREKTYKKADRRKNKVVLIRRKKRGKILRCGECGKPYVVLPLREGKDGEEKVSRPHKCGSKRKVGPTRLVRMT